MTIGSYTGPLWPGADRSAGRSATSARDTAWVSERSRDPRELEARAVEVAALTAGISHAQALQALDAASTLLRRAAALRLMSALHLHGALASPLERDVIEEVIEQVVAAVDSA
jgi:hypothetical protein